MSSLSHKSAFRPFGELRTDAGANGTRAHALKASTDAALQKRKTSKAAQYSPAGPPRKLARTGQFFPRGDKRAPPPTTILPSTIGIPTEAPWLKAKAFDEDGEELQLPTHYLAPPALGAFTEELLHFDEYMECNAEGFERLGGDKSRVRAAKLLDHMSDFECMEPVLTFVKVLLKTYKLDDPTDGGLSSYQICFLVAYHIEEALALGEKDNAGRILASFFFRYGQIPSHESIAAGARTVIGPDIRLPLSRRSCDFVGVEKMDKCITLFKECWQTLWHFMRRGGAYFGSLNNHDSSLLRYLVNTKELLERYGVNVPRDEENEDPQK